MDGRDRQAGSGRTGPKAARGERLAAALRENLRRRKAQARARQGEADPARAADGGHPADGGPDHDRTGDKAGEKTGDETGAG
jgi:hypothetical protein